MDVQQPRVNLKECETIKCDNCQGIYFREVIYIKKVSRFMIPNATEDQTVPFPIYKCDSCGHINESFNPFEEDEKQVISE